MEDILLCSLRAKMLRNWPKSDNRGLLCKSEDHNIYFVLYLTLTPKIRTSKLEVRNMLLSPERGAMIPRSHILRHEGGTQIRMNFQSKTHTSEAKQIITLVSSKNVNILSH